MKRPSKSEKGVSLVEILLALVMASVVLTLAITQFGGAKQYLHRENAARQLKVYLERARYDSVKRRPASSADWSQVVLTAPTSYRTTLDRNGNGTLEASDSFTYSFEGQGNVTIMRAGLIFPVTIAFNARGQSVIVNGDGSTMVNPVFTICGENCTLVTANAANSTLISVSPSGTVMMDKGGTAFANAATPNVSNVPTLANVNPRVKVNSAY